jgi:hypothetical protein
VARAASTATAALVGQRAAPDETSAVAAAAAMAATGLDPRPPAAALALPAAPGPEREPLVSAFDAPVPRASLTALRDQMVQRRQLQAWVRGRVG